VSRSHQLRAAAFAVAAVLALAGCGADDEPAGQAGAASGGGSEFPVTIEHKYGTTEVPAPPERVVTVGYTEQDAVLALGVKPAGVREFMGGYDWRARPWAQEALGGEELPTVGKEQINFEQVAARRPDLIIGINSGMSEKDYGTLSKIAPTIPQSGEFIDFGVPWQEQTLGSGRALGLEDEARKLVDEIEAQFARIREQHPEFDGKVAALAYGSDGGNFGAYASDDYRTRFFEDLGFKTPPEIDRIAGKSFYTEFSEEQIKLIDQDVVVMFASEDDVIRNPLYKRLKAVKEDRVIYLDLDDQLAGALGFGSPLSLPYAAEGFAPLLEAALDGDPETKIEQPE
jgi:iron complex transport system substrate-binding protein